MLRSTRNARRARFASLVSRPASFQPRLEVLESRCLLSVTSAVVGRHLFYDGSAFDGNTPGISPQDDAAIATDKSAYLPGSSANATFANISSYARGLNGVMIDISGSHPNLSLADFTFKVGNNSNPSQWLPAPSAISLTVRGNAGVNGADRVEIVWPEGAIKNQWLQVIVAAGANTGLAEADVFYFGSRVGDSGQGNSNLVSSTNPTDEIAARTHSGGPMPITNPYDYNRDRFVNPTDQLISRTNPGLINNINVTLARPALAVQLANDTAPDGATNNDLLTRDATVSGSLTAAASLTSFRAGLDGAAATTDILSLVQPDGSFTLSPAFLDSLAGGSLSDGTHTLHLVAADAQGLSVARELTFTLKRSTATPPLPDLLAADDTGISNSDNATAVTTPRVLFSGELGNQLRVFVDSVLVATGTAGPSYIATLPTLTEGGHFVYVVSVDAAGNAAQSLSLPMIVRTTPPTATLSTLVTIGNDLTPHVTVTASGGMGIPNGSQVIVDADLNNDGDFNDPGELNLGSSTTFNGRAYFELSTPLPATNPLTGPYTVQLRARVADYAGVIGTSPSKSLTIDTRGNDVLSNYVHAADPSYSYSLVNTIVGAGYTTYVIDMKSQTWRTAADVNRTLWQHWLQIIVPNGVLSSTALMLIGGGSNSGTPPTSPPASLVTLALQSHSVVVELPTVPNEPLQFTGDNPPINRSEDAIIAYSFEQYVNHFGQSGNDTWPALLPMVKSAVKAMDTVQAFVPTKVPGASIEDFVVTGYSKRGWTTWLTSAMDDRVRAIVPGVIDMLNLDEQMLHHYGFYGFFAPALNDYNAYQIPNDSFTFGGQEIGRVVDPYTYLSNGRFDDMPKLLINSAGDEFFVPDSAQFYFHDLPGTKNYLRYIPNTGHGLNGTDPANSTASFFDAVINNRPLPEFSWTLEQDGSIRVQTTTVPTNVVMWQATNPNARDFRRSFTPTVNWTSSALSNQGGGVYVANVATPSTGARAFFVELTFPSAIAGNPYVFTTEIRVRSPIAEVAWPFFMPPTVPPGSPLAALAEEDDALDAVAFGLALPADEEASFGNVLPLGPLSVAEIDEQPYAAAEPPLDWAWLEDDRPTEADEAEAIDLVFSTVDEDALR